MKSISQFTLACALAGTLSGLALGSSWGERSLRDGLRVVDEISPELPIDPLRGLTRAEARTRAERAQALLAGNRPWAAWTTLEPFVRDPEDAEPAVLLLAARAATEWTGWREVRTLLRGRDWLAEEGGGEGLYLLGRGEEGGEEWARAATAYAAYVRLPGAARRGEGYARLAHSLSRAGQHAAAAHAYAKAAELGGPAADWLQALAAEEAAAARDGAALARVDAASSAARVRGARAAAGYWLARGDSSRAATALVSEADAVYPGDPGAGAVLALAAGRLLVRESPGRAADLLLRAASAEEASASVRAAAAAALGGMDDLSGRHHLARAAAYEAAGKSGLAARALRSAFRAGAGDTPEQRLRLGRLLWEAVDLQPARAALLDAAERLPEGEPRAQAELLAARVLVRLGKRDEGIRALKQVAARFPETPAAGEAWFLLGDLSTTRELGIANYRRAAASAAPQAADALWRLGDRMRRSNEPAAAAAAWGRLAGEFPGSDFAPRAGYEAGRIHESAGRADAAGVAYRAAIAADPTSYYAIRAADRLGVDPLAAALARPPEWAGADGRAVQALSRLDALEGMGLAEAWAEELEAQQRAVEGEPSALLALAEGLRDRGHTIPAIRIGRALQARVGRWDERLLRVVFPLPDAELLDREADRVEVDPYLLAGLVRQESSWNPLARSRVGASGLAQVMPSTGEWLARSAGVRDFRAHHLTVPEIGLRMGARYLRDQLRRYRGRRDLALAAYNAGPGRADRWRRELAAGRDVDAFREAIPFDETREYVKLVIRNAEVYRRLYGAPRGTGLVRDR